MFLQCAHVYSDSLLDFFIYSNLNGNIFLHYSSVIRYSSNNNIGRFIQNVFLVNSLRLERYYDFRINRKPCYTIVCIRFFLFIFFISIFNRELSFRTKICRFTFLKLFWKKKHGIYFNTDKYCIKYGVFFILPKFNCNSSFYLVCCALYCSRINPVSTSSCSMILLHSKVLLNF